MTTERCFGISTRAAKTPSQFQTVGMTQTQNITVISHWSTGTARLWDECVLFGGNDLMMWLDGFTDVCSSFPKSALNCCPAIWCHGWMKSECDRSTGTSRRTDNPWCVEKQTMNIYLLTKGQSVSLLPSANTKGSLGRVPRVTAWDWKYVVPKFLHKWSHRKWFVFAYWEKDCVKASPNYNCWRDLTGRMSL